MTQFLLRSQCVARMALSASVTHRVISQRTVGDWIFQRPFTSNDASSPMQSDLESAIGTVDSMGPPAYLPSVYHFCSNIIERHPRLWVLLRMCTTLSCGVILLVVGGVLPGWISPVLLLAWPVLLIRFFNARIGLLKLIARSFELWFLVLQALALCAALCYVFNFDIRVLIALHMLLQGSSIFMMETYTSPTSSEQQMVGLFFSSLTWIVMAVLFFAGVAQSSLDDAVSLQFNFLSDHRYVFDVSDFIVNRLLTMTLFGVKYFLVLLWNLPSVRVGQTRTVIIKDPYAFIFGSVEVKQTVNEKVQEAAVEEQELTLRTQQYAAATYAFVHPHSPMASESELNPASNSL
jgi:hypothetical protein